jgi:prevent-host-death family protein
MKTAGVADLRARLASYLKMVKSGSEVLITERGVPIAKLVPINAARKRMTRRQRLAAAGHLTLGKGRVPKELLEPPPGDRRVGQGVLAALLAEREEGR